MAGILRRWFKGLQVRRRQRAEIRRWGKYYPMIESVRGARLVPLAQPLGLRGRKAGQAFVEMAIAIPVILTLILGGIQLGLSLLNLEALNHASRQAAIKLTTGSVDVDAILMAAAPAGTTVIAMAPCAGAGTLSSVTLQWATASINFFPLPSFPDNFVATGSATCTA